MFPGQNTILTWPKELISYRNPVDSRPLIKNTILTWPEELISYRNPVDSRPLIKNWNLRKCINCKQ